MSPGRNESPGVTSGLLAAARRSATDESKSKHHNDEDFDKHNFDKRNHDTIDV